MTSHQAGTTEQIAELMKGADPAFPIIFEQAKGHNVTTGISRRLYVASQIMAAFAQHDANWREDPKELAKTAWEFTDALLSTELAAEKAAQGNQQ